MSNFANCKTCEYKHMEAHDFDDLPDGAWFYCLEQAAQEFLNKYNLTNPGIVLTPQLTVI